MAKQTFTWFPDEESEESIEPDVNVTKFGDGYEIRSQVGINAQRDKWLVNFTGALTQTNAIRAFLSNHGAKTSFIWQNPFQATGLYVCRSWTTKRIKPSVYTVSATFERVHEEPWTQ